MKTKNFLPTLVLVSICVAAALLLSLVNMITAPLIDAAQSAAANEALVEIYPGGTNFQQIDISQYSLPKSITAVYKEGTGGYVIQSTVNGYYSGLVVMCGINKDGKIVGADYIQSNETLGAEIGLGDRFVGKTESDMTPDIVAGSTAKITTSAYYNAILDALKAFTILNGGTADLRTPEQILQDNCNAALGTTGITFKKWFATEVLTGVNAVYEAADKSGRVYVIGESFAGVKADGTIVNLGGADEATVKAADNAVKSSIPTEITELPDGIRASVTKISVTESGNYVFNVLGYGYKYESNYEFAGIEAGEIEIMISISANGKIIDVITVSHQESKGYGDVCATEEYYEQYRGHGNSDIVVTAPSPDFHEDQIPNGCTDIGAIASSTFTSTAYQSAVKAAFHAFELITAQGGNE